MIYKLYGLFSYILINIVVFCLINETKIMAPSTDCIGPIGAEELEDGLRRY